jgi:hypothetical protein
MNMEFKNAAFDAAGTACVDKQTTERQPSPTYPATAGGAGRRRRETQRREASSEKSPTGERDVPDHGSNPFASSTSRDNPAATPGEQATGLKQTRARQPVPTNPPCGAGDDAVRGTETSADLHHPTHPASAGGGGHSTIETHAPNAAAQVSASDGGGDAPGGPCEPPTDSASPTKSRRKAGEVGADLPLDETHLSPERPDLRFSDPIVAEIVQLHRHRRRWMKARTSLTLQCLAHARAMLDGDKDAANAAFNRVYKVFTGKKGAALKAGEDDLFLLMVPYLHSIQRLEEEEKTYLKTMVKLTMQLPIAPFIKETKGLGEPSAATIIGEAGDLSKYPSIAGVWKRLGLAVINGERQRKVADAEKALLHGYDPRRRSIVWNAGNNLIGGMGAGRRPMDGEDITLRDDWTPYEKLFVERLRFEAEKDPTHRRPNTKEGKDSYSKHAAARAKRYVEKRMLKDMTLAWRRALA